MVTGCAGGRTTIQANTSKYPISMSRGIRDVDGSLVPRERRRIVGHVEWKGHAWSLVYSWVSLTPSQDISDAINKQVADLNGDAVINLNVASSTCAMNLVPILDWLPIWPGCANVKVTGDVIQVVPGEAPPPPPSMPPPPPPPPAGASVQAPSAGGVAR
jgi:hypothetical protein